MKVAARCRLLRSRRRGITLDPLHPLPVSASAARTADPAF